MMLRTSILFAAAVGGLMLTAPAHAHPRLIASTPANGATVSNVDSVRLRFSEKLVPAFSKAELIMTGMPRMRNQQPMRVPVRTTVLSDGHTMAVTGHTRLQAGTYRLAWHAVSMDTHRVSGQVNFAVR